MAKSLDARGDKAGALSWCQRILATNPNLVDVAQYNARLLFQLGRHEEAVKFIDAFIAKFPTAKSYFEGLRRQIKASHRVEARVSISPWRKASALS
jgi:tetratricopeptide (TPR) repeat protein